MICSNCHFFTVLIEDDDDCNCIPWFRLRWAGCKNVTISRYRGQSREELIREAT